MRLWLRAMGRRVFDRIVEHEIGSAGLQSARCTLSFGAIAYLESRAPAAGDEAVLMVHGACADKSAWVRFAKALGGPRRLLILDLPGHGESAQGPAMDYRIATQSLRVQNFLQTMGVLSVHLIGNSMGSAIALRLAVQRPDLVKSLILMNVAGIEAHPSALSRLLSAGQPNPMTEVQSPTEYRAMMRFGMSRAPWVPAFVLRVLLEQKLARRASEERLMQDLALDLDQSSILDQVCAPALILWGREDRVTAVENANVVESSIRGSRKQILDGVGHVPMVEAPRLTAAACRAFLQEQIG